MKHENTPEIHRLGRDFEQNALLDLLFSEGASPMNWLPEIQVKEHVAGLASGQTDIWAAFVDGALTGFISSQDESISPPRSAEIGEFVVASAFRGRGLGTALVREAVRDLFQADAGSSIREISVVTHEENQQSQRAFLKAGFLAVNTFDDASRDRRTTVLRIERPKHAPE